MAAFVFPNSVHFQRIKVFLLSGWPVTAPQMYLSEPNMGKYGLTKRIRDSNCKNYSLYLKLVHLRISLRCGQMTWIPELTFSLTRWIVLDKTICTLVPLL